MKSVIVAIFTAPNTKAAVKISNAFPSIENIFRSIGKDAYLLVYPWVSEQEAEAIKQRVYKVDYPPLENGIFALQIFDAPEGMERKEFLELLEAKINLFIASPEKDYTFSRE